MHMNMEQKASFLSSAYQTMNLLTQFCPKTSGTGSYMEVLKVGKLHKPYLQRCETKNTQALLVSKDISECIDSIFLYPGMFPGGGTRYIVTSKLFPMVDCLDFMSFIKVKKKEDLL